MLSLFLFYVFLCVGDVKTNNGGWYTEKKDIVGREGPCNIERYAAEDLDQNEFLRRFAYHEPLVIYNIDNKEFRRLTMRKKMMEDWKNTPVTLNSANTYSYIRIPTTFQEYIEHRLKPQSRDIRGNETMYLFGDIDQKLWAPLLTAYRIPKWSLPGHSPGLSFGIAGAAQIFVVVHGCLRLMHLHIKTMASRRRGVGVAAVQRKQETQAKFNAKGEQMASEQLQMFSKQLEEFTMRLEQFAHRHRDEIRKNSQFRRHFQEMCASVGVDPLASGKGFWAEKLGVGDFYYELAVQIVEVCLSTNHINGGIMTVEEIRNRLMRSRSRTRKETITTDDILRSVDKLKVLGGGFELVPLGGGRFLVQSVPGELSMDHSRVLQLAEDAAYVTKELIIDRLRWDEPRAQAVLDHLVKEGLAWVDEQATDTVQYWVPSLFLQQYCHSSSSTSVSESLQNVCHSHSPRVHWSARVGYDEVVEGRNRSSILYFLIKTHTLISSNETDSDDPSTSIYYNESEASKYASNSHIIKIQTEMAERALELLALPEEKSAFLLDIGSGTGISGGVLANYGHSWVYCSTYCDVRSSRLILYLELASEDDQDRENLGDFVWTDMGTGLPFRPGTFDGAISISAVQWLCHANTKHQNPKRRLHRFFQTLYGCLDRGTRAVFQFYPENEHQSALIMSQAIKAGFNGGLVVDYPNSVKAKKVYLVLMTGGIAQLPKALTGEESMEHQTHVENTGRVFAVIRKHEKKPSKGTKEWINKKRERMLKQGRTVRHESKYSGRKRKQKF
ncbi:EAP30/Vps36 family protein [Necator americanus]|uniref:Vacuolar-sorting protein SNF8 n=1 Tax=Necator americanus TaxID=51031 RepID=W2TCN1_NECAM|nr:EAP30/Vps36 family protein [Necator americanus]ETN79608.1 EAP30/Vps36 family protein [Necator americanus]